MSDLTDFLLARIAEDEAAARDALEQGSDPEPEPWLAVGWPRCEHPGPVVLVGPERFLAECEAKRRIVEAHPLTTGVVPVWTGATPGVACQNCAALGRNEGDIVEDIGPCDTLLALANIYADHPAFREDWRL